MAAELARSSRTPSRTALVVSLIGLAISIYLTIEHFNASATLACPESATINCAKVTTSQWSHIAGIPVAVLGLAYFAGMTVLLVPMSWRVPQLDLIRIAGVTIGTAMVFYLVWIELFRVNAICIWCTGVHICTVLLLAAVLWHTSVVRSGVVE